MKMDAEYFDEKRQALICISAYSDNEEIDFMEILTRIALDAAEEQRHECCGHTCSGGCFACHAKITEFPDE